MITAREAADSFAISGKAFCILIDQHTSLLEGEFERSCAERLVELYQVGVPLCDIIVDLQGGEHECERISYDRWYELYADIGQKLRESSLYWEVFDPRVLTKPVVGDVADDLADIYRDVKNGLILYDCGYIDEAVSEWRESFLVHWGDHLVDALRYLHRIISAQVMDNQRRTTLSDAR
ncbi:MAG TPA: DUF5063 domain-containing protein [Capsulimonadaceae bacterium]